MNKSTARDILEKSFARGVMSPVPKGVNAETYYASAAEELRSVLIEPVIVNIKDAMFESGSEFDEFKTRKVWGIARRDNQWLLLAEENEEFALAFGDNPISLTMHGFASSDALTEWLG